MFKTVFTTEAARIFPKLNIFGDFYMAGGTAMALQMGHRVSVDFVFFPIKKFPDKKF